MKPILIELKRFITTYSHADLWIGTIGLVVSLLIFNYSFDFEDSYIDSFKGSYIKGVLIFLYQAVPYILTCFLLYIFGYQKSWIRSPKFWLVFILGFGILSFDRSTYLWPSLQPILPPGDARYIYSVIIKSQGLFTVIIPLLILYYLVRDESSTKNFGLVIKGFTLKPYLFIFFIGVGIVLIGGFIGDLQAYYPRYQYARGDLFALNHNLPELIPIVLYELAYGFDFISTEFFFRGLLVLGMYRFLGPYAVYPMIVAYCVLHFGKPLTEAVSSVFGGYILGVIALYHRNIWGGVIIHVGVAWAMEFAGFLY